MWPSRMQRVAVWVIGAAAVAVLIAGMALPAVVGPQATGRLTDPGLVAASTGQRWAAVVSWASVPVAAVLALLASSLNDRRKRT